MTKRKAKSRKPFYSKSGYWRHPCSIKGRVYPSIAEASRALGIHYSVMHKRLHDEVRGYVLLPYDGSLPTIRSKVSHPPHIYVEGGWYYSQSEAGIDLHVSQSTISNRIRSSDRPDYYVHLV